MYFESSRIALIQSSIMAVILMLRDRDRGCTLTPIGRTIPQATITMLKCHCIVDILAVMSTLLQFRGRCGNTCNPNPEVSHLSQRATLVSDTRQGVQLTRLPMYL